MSELMKANVEEGTYFVSFATVGWVDVFTRPEYADIVFDSLAYCQEHKGLELFEYVVMPSHMHLLCRRKTGLLSEVLRDMKSFTAKRLLKAIAEHPRESRKEWMMTMFREAGRTSARNSEFMFWQKTNHPEHIFTAAFHQQKANYIRNNPVTMGLVTEQQHYAWSSAHERPRLQCIQ